MVTILPGVGVSTSGFPASHALAERELQRAILARIERFLRERGGRIAFLGSPYRLEIDEREYFIDLLLDHRGLKENAGIFCHSNTWAVVAEAMLGRGNLAMRLYRSFLPAAKNDAADLYTMEPYVYSQFITGREHPYKFGRARNSWLTGAAAWAFVAISQHILGVRADYDGLVIDPAIPAEWDGYEVTRVFRGATYRIRVKNPGHISAGVRRMKVNGKTVEGNALPIAPAGATVKVDVTLEA